jgi:DNA polymerase-1
VSGLLPPVSVPDLTAYDPVMRATLHTGLPALDAFRQSYRGGPVAIDIETPSVSDPFTIKCVTAAWDGPDGTVSVLLDPSRLQSDWGEVRTIVERADSLVLHNSSFDVPGLVLASLMDHEHIDKIIDTLILARMTWSDTLIGKGLEPLAKRVLGMTALADGLKAAIKASGLKSKERWYAEGDIHMPSYRFGAMADTVVTLRLLEPLTSVCIGVLTDHPFEAHGCTTAAEAAGLMFREQRVNRIMLHRSARGLNVDLEHLYTYRDEVETELAASHLAMEAVGVNPGDGAALVRYLDSVGELPANWPRTAKTQRLSATKDDLEKLDHPLAGQHRDIAHANKILGYLDAVSARSVVSGRLHPQVGILGASATGRMSYTEPALQQFTGKARPIIVDDAGEGLTSVDWSQIEPVTMANMAHDIGFLEPFEAGADLYEPIMLSTGTDRKMSKVVLLALMYGQGETSLARGIKQSFEAAVQIKRQTLAAMPESAKFMRKITAIANEFGIIPTVSGRILSVPTIQGKRAAYKAVNFLCVTGHTPILTSDLRHVPAGTVAVGDTLVGFDEHRSEPTGRGTGKRFFRTAVVEDVRTFTRPGVRIEAGDRVTTCSAEHLWLVRCPSENVRLQWVRADELRPGYHQMMDLGLWEEDTSREAGYLAGLYDGEGSLTRRNLIFSQNPGPVMDAFTSRMDKLGLAYGYSPRTSGSTSSTDNVRIHGLSRVLRTVGTLRPERFVARSRDIYEGVELHTLRQMSATPVVRAVTPVGDIDVVSIQTSTRTLVANGYLSHNCQGSAYDVMAEAIIGMEDAGIAEHIVLAMHDEIVCKTPVAEEVQRIMLRPPEALCRWAGRTPVLRTDRADMGRTWLSV